MANGRHAPQERPARSQLSRTARQRTLPQALPPWYGAGMVKATFSVDEETFRILKRTAERLGKSQSLVVREAVAEYAARAGRLTDAERRQMVKIVDALMKEPPTRPGGAVEMEIREIRRARRHGGRQHPAGEPRG